MKEDRLFIFIILIVALIGLMRDRPYRRFDRRSESRWGPLVNQRDMNRYAENHANRHDLFVKRFDK